MGIELHNIRGVIPEEILNEVLSFLFAALPIYRLDYYYGAKPQQQTPILALLPEATTHHLTRLDTDCIMWNSQQYGGRRRHESLDHLF